MIKYQFVTTFPEKYNFGFDLVNTAEEHLPACAELIVYYDGQNLPSDLSKVKFKSFNPDPAKQFCSKANLFQSGKIPKGVKINSDEYLARRMFMWDAKRFCWKMYALMEHMAGTPHKNVMWIDADVEFIRQIPEEWIQALTKKGCYGSFLDRPKRYTETGFLWFDTNHPCHKTFWNNMSKLYNDLEIFQFSNGWMDCQAYDYCRKEAMKAGAEFFNLVYPGMEESSIEVWDRSILSEYSKHYKSRGKDK